MQDLHKFISTKAKGQGIKLEDLAKRCNFGRSTLWRYMKGTLPITPDIEEIFANALSLNESDKEKFRHYIGLIVPDENLLQARQALDDFVFGDALIPPLEDVTIVFFNQERYLRTLTEIFDLVLQNINETNYSCHIKIIDGIQERYFPAVADFLQRLLSHSPNSTAEQLVTFSSADYLKSIQTLITSLPLLQFKNYSLFYRETSKEDDVKGIMGRSFYIDCSYEKDGAVKKEFFLVSILDYTMSECIRYEDAYMNQFLMNDYNEVKQQYKNGAHDFRNIDIGEQFLLDKESACDAYLIKPNNCYNKVPVSAYNSLLSRMGSEERQRFSEALTRNKLKEGQVDSVISKIIADMDARIKESYNHRHIDVYSKAGLLSFAQTGRLSDHLDELYPFSKEEIKLSLEYIRDRNLDEKDTYTLYITNADVMSGGYIILGYKDQGVLVEYSQNEHYQVLAQNIFITNKMITDIICDYIETHIPSYQAIPKSEATDYLNHLIETYCN